MQLLLNYIRGLVIHGFGFLNTILSFIQGTNFIYQENYNTAHSQDVHDLFIIYSVCEHKESQNMYSSVHAARKFTFCLHPGPYLRRHGRRQK